MTLSIKKHLSSDAFEELKGEWESVFETSGQHNVFLTWEWLSAWWKHFGKQGSLYVLCCYDSQQIVAIAPFYIRNHLNTYGQKVVTFIGSSPISSDYMDIICVPGYEGDTSKALCRTLMEDRGLWDCIELNDYLGSSTCISAISEELKLRGLSSQVINRNVCPYLALPPSVEQLRETLQSRLRNTIKRKLTRLKKAQLEFKAVSEFSELPKAMNSMFALHQKRWEKDDRPGSFESTDIKNFHLDATQNLWHKNGVGVYEIREQDQTVAALYTLSCRGHTYYYQSGYDPSYHSFSPGTLVMWLALAENINAGINHFDFLRGDEPYKTLWTPDHRTTTTSIYFGRFNLTIHAKLIYKKIIRLAKRALRRLYRIAKSRGTGPNQGGG